MRPSRNRERAIGVSILTFAILVALILPLMSFPEGSATTWDPVEEISEDKRIEYQRYPAISADAGKAYAVWADNGDKDYDIMVREHDGAAWQLEEEVNTDDRDIDQFLPDIAADGGVVHVVWHDPINGDYDIMYRRKSGGAWDPLRELSADVGIESQQNPVVAAADGKAYVVWQDGRGGDWDIFFRYHDGTVWSSIQEISVDSGSEAQSLPSISAGGGRAFVVWEDAGGGDNDIMMRVFDGASWGSIMEVSQDSTSEIQNVPDVAYDVGKVHVVWEEFRTTDRDIYHRSWDGSSFSAIQEISVDSGTEFQDLPSIAAQFGKVHAVWADRGDGDWDIVYRQHDGSSWQAPQKISEDMGSENQWLPDVATDGGVVHVVWEDQGDGDNDIFYRRGYEGAPVDTTPPDILDVYLDGSAAQTYPISSLPPTMTLTATVDDSARGGSFIGGANYTIGPGNWGTSSPMTPDDFLNSPTEGFHATLATPSVAGSWQYCVYGWDIVPNYNTSGLCASLTIYDDLPPVVTSILIDGFSVRTVPAGTPSVTLTATVDDSTTGDSIIGGANYTSPSQNWLNVTSMIPDDILDAPVEGFHATIDTSSLGLGSYDVCAYGWDDVPNNDTAGACATLTVAGETKPPVVRDVLINGLPSVSYGLTSIPTLTLTAIVDDLTGGGSTIGGANYTIGPQNWPSAMPMVPDDVLDSPIEGFHADVDSSSFNIGTYQICVYGWDNTPNYNTTGSCASLAVTDDIEPEVHNVLIDGFASKTVVEGTVSVQLTATVDDRATGGSVVAGANYTIGAGMFPGMLMNTVNPPLDLDVEDFTYDVPTGTLAQGVHQICVYGWDAVPNHNLTGACASLTVATETDPPMVTNVLINGQPFASYEVLTVPLLTLTATVDDSIRGNSVISGANYTIGPNNWPTATPMSPDDILDTSVEGFHSTLTTPSTTGTWEYCVYGWDITPNFDTTGSCATLSIYDGTPPLVTSVLVDGVAIQTILSGTASVSLTATVDDSARGESIIAGANYTSPSQDWLNSTPMIPDDSLDTPTEGFYAIIDTSSLGLGTYDICVYGWDEVLNNDTTGSCVMIVVSDDIEPPVVSNVRLNGQATLTLGFSQLNGILITANVDDTLTGNSSILGANYSWGPPTWPGAFMWPTDGFFDSPIEDVNASVTAGAQAGTFEIWVQGCDEYYNCNTGSATLIVQDDMPPAVSNVLLDSQTTRTIQFGTLTVTLTAEIDDTLTGGSFIGGANFTSPSGAWSNSTVMTSLNPPLDNSVELFAATVDTGTLGSGTYEIWVYGWDTQNNFNVTPSAFATLVVVGGPSVDNPPVIDSLTAEPSQAEEGEDVEVVVVATDDGTVEEVRIEVVGPDGQVISNVSAGYNDPAGGYLVVLSYDEPGQYNITAWVRDDGGNWASEEDSFEVLESELVQEEEEPNYKPALAALFAILLLVLGLLALRAGEEESKIRKFWFLPFALAELATCAVSASSGALSIPPVLGAGLLVDLVAFLLGLSMPVLILLRKSPAPEEESGTLANGAEESNYPENTK